MSDERGHKRTDKPNWQSARRSGNYQIKIARLLQSGVLQMAGSSLSVVDVFHEDGCSIIRNGHCDCGPEIRTRIVWQQNQ